MTFTSICELCGEEHPNCSRNKQLDQIICHRCYTRHFRPRRPCAMCGEKSLTNLFTPAGDPICPGCYRTEFLLGVCSMCEETRTIAVRVEEKPVCTNCYQRKLAIDVCAGCKQEKSVAHRTEDGEAVCQSCYFKTYAEKIRCTICGKRRLMRKRGGAGRGICSPCYHQIALAQECHFCRETRRVATRTEDGFPVCAACYNDGFRQKEKCGLCGRECVAQTRSAEGAAICQACYRDEVRVKKPCEACGVECLGVARTPRGGVLCERCHSIETKTAQCTLCGRVAILKWGHAEGTPCCGTCYKEHLRVKEPCADCGRVLHVAVRRERGSLCDMCYKRDRPKEKCTFCGRMEILGWGRRAGTPCCGTCYQTHLRKKEACADCGRMRTVSVRRERGPLCNTCEKRERRASVELS